MNTLEKTNTTEETNTKYTMNDFTLNCLLLEASELLKLKTLAKNKNIQEFLNTILCLIRHDDMTQDTKIYHDRVFNKLKELGLYDR